MEVPQIEILIPTKSTIRGANKKYSSAIRLWHWLNAVVITGSLLTVLVNSTVLKPWTNAALISEKLEEKGVQVSQDEARSVAFSLADQVWAIHTYFGYTLAVLLLFRIVLEYFELADRKLIRKIKTARKSFLSIQQNRIASRNEMLVKTSYALFYVLLMVMVVTGLCLAFKDDVAALKSMHFIKDIHGFTMYLILGFVFIHIAGVLLGERKQHKGIISHMVNGGEAEN